MVDWVRHLARPVRTGTAVVLVGLSGAGFALWLGPWALAFWAGLFVAEFLWSRLRRPAAG